MKTKYNLLSALILQIVTSLSGLILPRIIIMSFGSSINGLISSISQFLSFISLLEGGLGAVVLAELYKPIEQRNVSKINDILSACNSFFKKLSIVFIAYTIVLMILYPILFSTEYSYSFISSLIFILSISTLIQYMLSITYTLLLQADQKVYICNIVSSITILLNLIIGIVVIKVFPNVHIMKLLSGLVYLLQPIIYKKYFIDNYDYNFNNKNDYKLKNKWSGFSQNLAHYITMNTDVMVLTLFTTFKEISVYSVYMLALNALRLIVSSVAGSYQSNLGKLIASDDEETLNNNFRKFETMLWVSSLVLFSTCLLLINGFVNIYTSGVHDTNYFQPIFAYIMVLGQMFYSGRESYRLLILSAGKFKETNFGAIIEAILNLSLSIILVKYYGLIGVAFGTLVSIIYRLGYFIYYLSRNMVILNTKQLLKEVFLIMTVFAVNTVVYFCFPIEVNSIIQFIITGSIVFILESAIIFIASKILKLI